MDVLESEGTPPKDHSAKLSEILTGLAKKYDDPANVDRIEKALQKVDVIKQEMREVRLFPKKPLVRRIFSPYAGRHY